MSEQSEALELFNCYKYEILSWVQISEEELNVIEQALEQAQENKAMLDIFKSALTIEHHLSTPSFKPLEKDKTFDINAAITETIKIKQNDLDEKLRKQLREWVLKNAFPKELKALGIIKEKPWLVSEIVESKGDYKVYKSWCSVFRADMKNRATEEEYELLKEVLL